MNVGELRAFLSNSSDELVVCVIEGDQNGVYNRELKFDELILTKKDWLNK
jgi:hypothetical protein